jgi:ABC-2 type transport system ATP-binding protein
MNSITVDRASKRLGETWALRDITLEVGCGEVFGVFGRSGAGKSTLARLIGGLDHPTAGVVALQVARDGDPAWLDARVSVALQRPGLAPELTVIENLRLFASLWNSQRRGRVSRMAMFCELLGLSEVRGKRVRQLSDGMKAAAEIARALIPRTEVVVIDGLLERLDRPVRRRLWEYLLSRRRHGETFIIATASADEAELCDRLAVLSKGRLMSVGTPSELVSGVKNEIVVVESIRNPVLKSKLKDRFGAAVTERNGSIEFRSRDASADVARILTEMPSDVGCLSVREPTLDDLLDRIEAD